MTTTGFVWKLTSRLDRKLARGLPGGIERRDSHGFSRSCIMKRMLLGMGVLALSAIGAPGLGVSEAVAQVPGESVVYETVAPGTRTINYGERVTVRRGLFGRTVIKERPVRYVTTTPPVVRETRVIRPAPIIEQQVVQPAPVIQTRMIQSAPVVQRVVVPANPVIQTRYYGPYPY
jgi:hypothetical protein